MAPYGQGTGPIILDDMFCTGSENTLFDCNFDANTLDCRHSEDAGVMCFSSGRLPSCYQSVHSVRLFVVNWYCDKRLLVLKWRQVAHLVMFRSIRRPLTQTFPFTV